MRKGLGWLGWSTLGSWTLVAVAAVVGCGGGSSSNDAGPPGIDANIPPRADANESMCSSTGPENTPEACMDGCDNDGDSFADCRDFDCCGLRACPAGTPCGDRGDAGPRPDAFVMECPTMGPENTVEACTDGCSNDGDRFVDCDDFDCCGIVVCEPTTSCGRLDAGPRRDAGPRADAGPRLDGGPRCDAGMGAMQESGETACADGLDNDCDGFVDCRDFSCSRDAPRDRTWCLENTAALCGDDLDNDGDGFVDCEDRDCCAVRARESCPMGSYIGAGRC